MSTHAAGPHAGGHARLGLGVSVHWAWLAGGFLLAFAVPFVLADTLAINRDLFYGLYAVLRDRSLRVLVALDRVRPRTPHASDAGSSRSSSGWSSPE